MATTVHLEQYTNLTWCWVSFTHSWNKDIIATASKKIPVKWGEALLSIGAHTHTHVQEISITAQIKADRLCMILSKLSSNQLLLILSICSYLQQFPTTAQHLTYPLPAVQRLHHSSFQICPQAEQKGTYATEYARLSQHTAQPMWECGFTIVQRKRQV